MLQLLELDGTIFVKRAEAIFKGYSTALLRFSVSGDWVALYFPEKRQLKVAEVGPSPVDLIDKLNQ